MGIWAEIKMALNSTLGRNLKTLDKIIEEASYDSYYESMAAYVSAYGSNGGAIVVHPRGATRVRVGEYRDNSIVKSVILPNGINIVSEESFAGCSALSHITLSKTIKEIGLSAFAGCISLKSIEFPNSVRTLGPTLFTSAKVENIVIGSGVMSIGYAAINPVVPKVTILYNGTIAQWNAIPKSDGWFFGNEYTIHCIDGDLNGRGEIT